MSLVHWPSLSCLGLVSLSLLNLGCEPPEAQQEPKTEAHAQPDPMLALRVFEDERRKATDFEKQEPQNARLGADPVRLLSLGRERFVALLRGRDALVVLDAESREQTTLPAPPSPTGLSISNDGQFLYVVGEHEGAIARYEVLAEKPYLKPSGRYSLQGVRGLRDVAASPEGLLYVVEEITGRLLTIIPDKAEKPSETLSAKQEERVIGHGPVDIERVGPFVLTLCVLDHAVVVHEVDEKGKLRPSAQRIERDGPIWSFAASMVGERLVIATGAVENHPLDRREGFFGYVDSFVSTYEVDKEKPKLVGEVNVSELGVVTPKALLLDLEDASHRSVLVTAYGSEKRVRLPLDATLAPLSQGAVVAPMVAGTSAIAKLGRGGFVASNPLLDAFVIGRQEAESAAPEVVPIVDRSPKASDAERLGEALFFTTLMAPENKTDGAHSRFTCETCHFEGYVDGRIHHTGRGDVRVVTKPLLGLFNNRPHFSRALDPDLSSIAHNEFRVAGAGNEGISPWFVLSPKEHPTLGALGIANEIEPLELRRSLMSFLMRFTHRTNPMVVGRAAFAAEEREGALLFHARCEGCHQARLSTDEPGSRVPYARWESLIFSPQGPIVWSLDEYRKTGVVPYVHDKGARVPSLRRLYKKFPYLTSGKAKTLGELLERAAWTSSGGFVHDNAPEGESVTRLSESERAKIEAFLRLL